MGKSDIEPVVVRQSFSHARTKPLVIEKANRRTGAPTEKKPIPLCPSCGARMKLVRSAAAPGASPKLTAACTHCRGGAAQGDD